MTTAAHNRFSSVLGTTWSVCPVCLRKIEATRVVSGDNVYLQKNCPDHGVFSTLLWRGVESYRAWTAGVPASSEADDSTIAPGCPFECGLCASHLQPTCCVILEVTSRCNLACPVCFASASASGADLPHDEILTRCRSLLARLGQFNLQLSGGEPTLRDDLPQIVREVRALGVPFVQVNTNGLRLASDTTYAVELRQAGLDCVFLQFDGVSDHVYTALRGRPLFDLKRQTIRNCAAAQLGVVLVATLVPRVNIAEIGAILHFASAHLPAVRAVHFQPVSYFGRYPQWAAPAEEYRLTIPDVLRAIEAQTGGLFHAADFRAPSAEHPACSFQGRFSIGEDGSVSPVATPATACCSSAPALVQLGAAPARSTAADTSVRAQQAVARQWAFPAPLEPVPGTESLDAFLAQRRRTLSISGMAFQDAWNLDLDRLRRCFLHVAAAADKLIPLCAYNLTSAGGTALYRGAQSLDGQEAQ